MTLERWTDEEIRREVQRHYAELAKSKTGLSAAVSSLPGLPVSVRDESSCCSVSVPELGGNLAKLAGYSQEELEGLPSGSVGSSFGCGNPVSFMGVREGQTVLDIGSGAGMDCLLAARKVGPKGRVIGLDMTPEMIGRARDNARKFGVTNVEFRLGEAEEMPLEDHSVDWVISNCVINLSPDKDRVFAEMARVLKPGGQICISDIVLAEEVPSWFTEDLKLWASCVAGAITEKRYLEGLSQAGFSDLEIADRLVYDRSTLTALLGGCCSPEKAAPDEKLEQLEGKVISVMFRGTLKA